MPFTAVLLAGGQSSRMGEDKAFLDFRGQPLWEFQLEKLRALYPDQILVSARRGQPFPDAIGDGVRVVVDDFPDIGPIGGVITCLKQAQHPLVLFLAVDLPSMPVEFLRQNLLDRAFLDSGVVYRGDKGYEPFAALYPKSMLMLTQECLRRQNYALQNMIERALEDGALQSFALAPVHRALFANANSPEDLEALRAGPAGREDRGGSKGSPPGGPESDQSRGLTAKVHLTRVRGGGRTGDTDLVAHEAPLEIRVEGKSVAVTMRTPGNDEELAAGFLLTEGVVTSKLDIFELTVCPNQAGPEDDPSNIVDVLLTKPEEADLEKLTRHVFTSSSCGICGKATIDAVLLSSPPIETSISVSDDLVLRLPECLAAHQETFEKTGGLHACALFDLSGNLRAIREDVGRHNALDKLLGHALLEDLLPLTDTILLLSGRVSFEMMQKALAARVPVVAAISAPTSLAVDFARKSNQSLIAFVRDGSMNIYT